MVKRLFSLVVALAIAGAPVAPEACQIACASTTVHPMAAAHHAHHDHATADGRPCHEQPRPTHQLAPHVPPCDHDGEATVASVAAARTSDGVLLYAVAAPPSADVVFAGASTVLPDNRPALTDRLEIRLASPLRI